MMRKVICLILGITALLSAGELEKMLDKLASDVARDFSRRDTIVFWGVKPLGEDAATGLGRYLGMGFSNRLISKMPGRVRDPLEGEKTVLKEMNYHVQNPDPSEVLKRFQAAYSLTGRYVLHKASKELEIFIQVSDSLSQQGRASANRRIVLGDGEFAELARLDRQRPPAELSREAEKFLVEPGPQTGLIDSAMVVTIKGREPTNRELKTGKWFKLEVDLKQRSYIYVIGFDTETQGFYFIYPGIDESANLYSGRVIIPRAEDVAFQAVPPAGFNWTKVIATRKPVEWKGLLSMREGVSWLTSGKIERFIRNLNEQSGGWQSVLTEVFIVE